jgi:hypothetical protein
MSDKNLKKLLKLADMAGTKRKKGLSSSEESSEEESPPRKSKKVSEARKPKPPPKVPVRKSPPKPQPDPTFKVPAFDFSGMANPNQGTAGGDIAQQLTQAMNSFMQGFQKQQQLFQEQCLHQVSQAQAGSAPAPVVDDSSRASVSVPMVDLTSSNEGASSSNANSKSNKSSRDDDSDDEFLSPESRTTADNHAKRRMIIGRSLQGVAGFSFQSTPKDKVSPMESMLLGTENPEQPQSAVPIQEGLFDQMGRLFEGFHVKYKKPDKLLHKMYRVPNVQERKWSYPPQVPTHLKNSVEGRFMSFDPKIKDWVLNKGHKTGKDEQKALTEIARSQLFIRITNILASGIVASKRIHCQVQAAAKDLPSNLTECMTKVKSEWESQHGPDEPWDSISFVKDYMDQWSEGLILSLKQSDECLLESQLNTADINKLVFDTMFSAIKARRDAWASSSCLKDSHEKWLCSREVPIPSKSLEEDRFYLLSTEDDEQVREMAKSYDANRSKKATDKILNMSFQTGNRSKTPQKKAAEVRPKTNNSKPQSEPSTSNQPFQSGSTQRSGQPKGGANKRPFYKGRGKGNKKK